MKEAFYFSHDSNAIQDPKMMTLLFECGLFGIGAFWVIIEILHQQQCGRIAAEQFKHYLSFYGKQGAWDEFILNKCEKVMFDTGLLVLEDGEVYSQRVLDNKSKRQELSDKAKESSLKRWDRKAPKKSRNAVAMPTQCEGNAIKERKGKEKKDSIVETTPQADKPLTDIQKIVLCYKLVSGYPKEDKAWDKLNFARCSKSAKQLLDFLGNWRDAADCIEDIYDKFTAKGLTVTIETAVKHASEWKMNQSEQREKVYDNAGSV